MIARPLIVKSPKHLWLAAAVIVAAARLLPAQPLTHVRVAYDGFTMSAAPLDSAARQGIFRTFGLDVTPTFIEGDRP